MRQLLLATKNAGKVREIRTMLADLPAEIHSLFDYPDNPEIQETGATLKENALIKARAAFQLTRIPSLADDSGLEVFALNNEPGVFSARYAGENVSDDDNNRKLLLKLHGLERHQRAAQFRCVIAFVAPGIEKTSEGICLGRIAESPRGMGGFGYDPIFIPHPFEHTFAELPPDVKNRISHRALAIQALRPFLVSYFR